MKRSKGMQLGALLAAMLLVSITFAAVVSAEPAVEKLPDNQRATVVTNVVNNPGIGELPMPVFREVVIVYFKEMPASIEEFASKYGGKLIFIKQDIKMAAFEIQPVGKPGETSQRTLDFITEVSKDSVVEKSFKDGFKFIDTKKVYSPKPKILDSEYYNKLGVEYVPNKVVVGFWRLPPSLEGFASKYGGRLMNLSYSDKVLGSASFETDNISEFINNVSNDPYVEYAELDGIGHIASMSANNTLETTPKAPGFELILSIGLLAFMVYMRRRKSIRLFMPMLLIGMTFMFTVHAASAYTPNDPYWNNQWGPGKIYAPQAWDVQRGSTSITVAILDTGIDYNHEDLAGRVIQGWNFVNNSNVVMDDNSGSHGTHVSGIAGAIMDNSKGIAGIAQTELLAVKVCNFMGNCTWNSIRDGITYAADNGAKVISMSIGKDDYSSAGEQAANYAYNTKGALLVAVSGEPYIGNGIEYIQYPGNFSSVIAVGATDSNDQLASFSNYGAKLELVAPGVNIYSTTRNNGYGYNSGTSMAVPHVSGVAALIWSQNPSFNNEKVREVMRNTAYDLGSAGRDIYYGYGKVNAYGAVTKGKLLTTPQSGTITTSGGNSQYSVNIPVPSIVNVVMAGNENADFDLYAKWGSPPTTSNYDAKSDSSYSLEYFPIKGSGTLYIMVKSYSGTGNWKSWVIGGLYTDSGKKQGTLSSTGAEATYSLNGLGIGYAFNSGPDGSNFDLYTKWYSPPTTSSYDARGNSLGAQEIAGPASFGNGTNYFMVHSTSGSGEYVTAGMIY